MGQPVVKIPEKIFFKIGEVCELIGVQAHVLRYWETEFSMLTPQKNRSGQRTYRRRDVEIALRIKELLYDEKFTIARTKEKLAEEVRAGGSRLKAAEKTKKSGRFDLFEEEQYFPPESAQGAVGGSETKHMRLADGATVRDFAEKLGIVPRDIVKLLLKKGIFATLNQPINERLAIEMGEDFGYEVSFVPFEEIVVEEEFEELIGKDPSTVSHLRAYEEVIDFIAAGIDPGKIIAFRPSKKARERVEKLVELEKSGELSPDGQSELDHYLNLEHLMRLAKARACDYLENE